MRIAHIVCAFPPYKGGMGNSAYHFARINTLSGHDVTVFTPDYGVSYIPEPTEKFKVVRLKTFIKYGNGAFLPQLLWRLNGFDVVHLHYPFYGAMEVILLRNIFLGKKTNLVMHYHMDAMGRGVKGLFFKLSQWIILPLLARASKLISCASIDYVKHSDLATYYKKHPEKFRKTFFGVELDKFKIIKTHCPYNDEDAKHILFVGGLDRSHYFKGLENLLKAVQIIRQEIKVKLCVIGNGNMKEYYEKLAVDLGIKDTVRFACGIGNADLVNCYNCGDVLVLPSINRGEAFGLVLLEAMACAKPIIASNLPGIRSVFKNGREGLLIEPDDIEDLAVKLKIILTNDVLAKKMGAEGRKLVERDYSWDKVKGRLDEVYNYVKYTPV